jgi:hypothetical protein
MSFPREQAEVLVGAVLATLLYCSVSHPIFDAVSLCAVLGSWYAVAVGGIVRGSMRLGSRGGSYSLEGVKARIAGAPIILLGIAFAVMMYVSEPCLVRLRFPLSSPQL